MSMVTLSAVRRERKDSERRAQRRPTATAAEWEMGWDDSDARDYIRIMRSEAERLRQIEAWFASEGRDEVAAIPVELTSAAWMARESA